MFTIRKSNNKKSKIFTLTVLIVSLFVFLSTASAQKSETKPRPAARLTTTVSQNDLNKDSKGDLKNNHPKNLTSLSEKKEDSSKDEDDSTFVPSAEEKKALELINRERKKYGFVTLTLDYELCRLARSYSETMARNDFFSHRGVDGKDVQGRARDFGIKKWKAIGENLAFNQGYDDPIGFAVEHWMLSSSHRANVLLAMWTATGIGVAKTSDDCYYITQVFITR
jgi:uncharacterized protein YkwD